METPSDGDENGLPYPERASWKDIVPVKQDDGPHPLAVIRYPPHFEEVHDYFRAIQQREEFSERALRLTADVIEHNSANYTAWYYRRRCLKELEADLDEELEFTDKWARDCPKNYQVWYHRRWLITEVADNHRKKLPASEADDKIRQLGNRELEYHSEVMQDNDDYKNYNGWSHRQFIVQKFGLWDKELKFVEELILDDIRNNSAWNHRFTTVKNTSWPLTEEVRKREIGYTLQKLQLCANNESAWNYLAAFFGEGPNKVSWDSVPEVEELCKEVLALTPEPEKQCRFAIEAVARIHEARKQTTEAIKLYEQLKDTDKIRINYWTWRIALLLERSGK